MYVTCLACGEEFWPRSDSVHCPLCGSNNGSNDYFVDNDPDNCRFSDDEDD